MDNFEGQTFAGYEILSKLGQGGMGAVYKARQTMLNRLVALKMMAPSLSGDPAFVARFIREASAAANLNHPNMVQVYTAGENDKIYYIVMEFVEGESLRIRLDRMERIPPQEAVAITVYIAQALQYAWNKAHLIHRDIKPDNVFLSNAGEVKVGDLGLAKSVGGGETTDMTQTGMVMGSPHYISPEQAQGAKDIDFRADIYSLGCTLYHMLTGKTPYEGDSSMVIMMKHINDPPPAIFRTWPGCPMPLGRLVGKMVAKRRQERHQSYEDLVADLMQVHEKLRQSESVAPVATTPAPATSAAAVSDTVPKAKATDTGVTTQAKARNQKLVYVAAGVCAAVALAGLLWWSPWKTPQQESVAVVSQVQPLQPAEPRRQEVVAPITSLAPAAPPASPAPSAQPQPEAVADAAWQNAINLLPLVDVGQDAVRGRWQKQGNELNVQPEPDVRLQFPYAPPEEYDFRIEFTVLQGNPDVAQLVTGGGRDFAWKMGHAREGPNMFGFEIVKGRLVMLADNPTRTILPWKLELGRRHTSIVRIRKDGVTGIVNGQTVTKWSADYRDMSQNGEWKLHEAGLLGVGGYRCAITFHRAEVIEVTGKGKFTRAVPDSQLSASPAPTPAVPASVATAQTDDGFQPLFNGRDLTGWSPREVAARKGSKLFYQPTTGGWMVQNGELVCASGSSGDLNRTAGKDPPTFFLKSNGEYGNFILQLEFKLCPNGHSGLYIRCSEAGNRNISSDGGMKIPILDAAYAGRMQRTSKYRTGAIAFVTAEAEASLRATGQWNSMEIRCEGDNVAVTVNGTRTATANMSQEPKLRNCPRSGYIAIANWCCEANGMSFRNIRIKELGAAVTPASSRPPANTLVLFDGKNSSAWKDRRGEPCPWKILEDGSLETVPRSGDIATEQKFRDFQMHLEFWLPMLPPNVKDQARANSGVFLQGLYEIQVLDSYNNPTHPMGGCGSIFKVKDPDNVDAALKPPETWNTYDITFRAARLDAAGNKIENARVTLLWNGVKVHDNAEIPGPTLGNKGKEGDSGPIRLQDHGGKVRYRNIWIQPLDDSAPATNAAAPTSTASANVAAAPDASGFLPLFNGKDLTGWVPMASSGRDDTEHQPTTGGWNVQNGELVCATSQTGWLKSERQYGDYVLQVEFKLVPDGNSDVYIRCPTVGHIARVGMSIQIIDPNYRGRRLPPEKSTGAIYDVIGLRQPPVRPPGEWNSTEIRCEGDNVEVTLNGTRTVAANMIQEPELRNRPRSGYIGIGNWHGEANGMSFRNIRIKELGASAVAPVTPHSSLVTPTDAAFAREVAALPPIQQVARVVAKLKELNPNFDGKETHKIEGGAVTELAISTVGLRNLAPVSALKQLKKLTIAPWTANQKGVLADLSPLRELPLSWLYCQNNPISDLAPLKGLPLTVIGCGGTQVSDLLPLVGMKLTVLSINDTAVSNLSPLSGMPLTVLWCNNTSVNDFSPLASSPLQELRCDFRPQRDAGALRGIPTLRKLNDQPAAALLKQAAASTAGGDIRVLIVTGVDLGAHDWRSTGPAIRNELQKDPRMKVEILNDIYRLDSTDLSKFQVVLLNFYTRGKPDPNEQAHENLKNFVNRGGGLVIFHSTCGSFRDWPEFRDLAGKIMDSQKGGYDKQGPMRVKIANANHPITRGMQPYETTDELYAFLSGRKPVQVLVTAHARSTGSDEPMAFVFDYGKGRVFHFVLGHDVRAIETAGTAELLRRGAAWVAGREPAPLTATPRAPR